MADVLVIDSHPGPGRLCSDLAHRYATAAEQAGASVHTLVLRELSFDPHLSSPRGAEQPLEPDLASARTAFEQARHLVWCFPVWWASTPALLKGFVDRMFQPGWAYAHRGGALPEGLLAGRTARLVSTMDSPWWWYRLAHGRAAHRQLRRATLHYCGVRPVWHTTGHGVRTWDADDHARFADRVARDARRDVARLRTARPRLTA